MTALDPANNSTALQAVRETLNGVLGTSKEPIDPQDYLDLLPNADSVRLMRAVSNLERRYDVEFDDTAIRDAETVADLVALVEDTLAQAGRTP